jgi:hypothetical protein
MRRLAVALTVALIASSPVSAEQKNVKVLKGLTDYQLVRAMRLISASLGVNCGACHAPAADGKGLDFPSDARKEKQTARTMISMVLAINAQNFEGRPQVSCNTCHRGSNDPVGIVPLPQPPPPEPRPEPTVRPQLPTRDEIVAKYAAAIGKPQRALWESRRLTGTREGSDGKPLPLVVEEAPGMAHATVTTPTETMEQAATPAAGWTRNAKGARPLSEAEVAIFNSLANSYAPLLPESIPADARVVRRVTEGGRDVYVVVFRTDPGTRERLELDTTSGLLVRRVTLVDTPVGVTPQQADFDDWRDVGGGVKYPFTVKVSPVDARLGSTRHYTEVRLGAHVDEKAMEMPK